MNIFIVSDDTALPLDRQQLACRIRNAVAETDDVPAIGCELIGHDEFSTLSLADGDIVIVYGMCTQDDDCLHGIVDRCEKLGVRLALATKLPVFRTDVPDAAYPTAVDMAVRDVARERRLHVLDLFAYAMSWYMREYESERAQLLEPVEGGRRLSGAAATMVTSFVARWVVRRYFSRGHITDRLYGASMYPEMWSEETNDEDMNHAHDIGMNAVRIGEFFWSKLEPEEGHYDMAYLEGLLDRYRARGLKVVLGVPTPTPPRWFTLAYPQSCVGDADGRVMRHGSRQHVCTNNPDYRRKAYQLTRRIGEVASRYPNVVAIQLDNEFKCHVDMCFCETCRRLWPQWLQSKYGDIETLNAAWGTGIWSERYDSFADVVMPEATPFAHNSSLDYAFRTFTADTLTQFASGLAQILVEATSIPLTHNTSTNFNLRNYDLFDQLDIVGFDTYPNSLTPWMFPMNLGLWRNLIPNDDVLLLETCSSHVGYTGNYMLPHPTGFLETEVFLGYASGLRSFLYWLYRGQKHGVEQPHGAVVTAAGTPDIGYDDVLASQRLLSRQSPFLEETEVVRSSVAMVYSDEARRAYNVESGGIYNFKTMVTDYYHALSSRGVDPELIPENADFTRYRCVLMPFVRCVDARLLAKCRQYVEQGGKLVLGPMTGDRTADMAWNTADGNGLGELGEWMGVSDVVQYLSADPRTEAVVSVGKAHDALGGLVTMFRAERPLDYMTVTSDVAAGRTAVARRDGAVYIGGIPAQADGSAFWDALVAHDIAPFDDDRAFVRAGGAVLKFRRDNERYADFHIANMGGAPASIDVAKPATDLDGMPVAPGTFELAPFACALLRFAK
ncbi:MAG: beta-galactosidase [Bifidobacterium castoris]|nr:beta-galactosidase [Bifidobacterium castoris]